MVSLLRPVPTTDQSLSSASTDSFAWSLHGRLPQIKRCIIEVASRQIVGSRQVVARFMSTCQSAATSNLWTRITTLCDALNSALLQLNVATGGRPLNTVLRGLPVSDWLCADPWLLPVQTFVA